MKFFVDTASLDEIREANDMGVLDGVTTNPSLMKREGDVDFHERIFEICELVDGDVSAEVTATDFDGIMGEAHTLAKIHDNVVVKVPLILDGIKALNALRDEGIPTNCTLCFSPTQALIAAKAGPPISARSWAGWMISPPTASRSCSRSWRSTTTTAMRRKCWPPPSATPCTLWSAHAWVWMWPRCRWM